ncbi:hypothetical protein, partial [Mycobacteroides abscessus]|uniref:hypothetical protein n=1 Tax=Mycobacteroides abscessus TaxID=36809 RepID=UPI001A99DE3F
ILGKVRPFLRRLTEAHPQVLIIAQAQAVGGPATAERIPLLPIVTRGSHQSALDKARRPDHPTG